MPIHLKDLEHWSRTHVDFESAEVRRPWRTGRITSEVKAPVYHQAGLLEQGLARLVAQRTSVEQEEIWVGGPFAMGKAPKTAQ